MPLRNPHRAYNRISASQDAADGSDQSNDEPLSPDPTTQGNVHIDGTNNNSNGVNSDATLGDKLNVEASTSSSLPTGPSLPQIRNEISVVLLDGAQTKFNIKCDPQWKVSEFKAASATVTKVPPQSQRLIHMGKLLQDDKTLDECGINENEKIVHLFPKPNVVINPSSSSIQDANGESTRPDGTSDINGSNGANADGAGTAGGAHVPQIILDAEEASRRSQILILSSQEIFEAQHRVKIFSFLLMIISSMELLTLMTLFVGEQAEDASGYGGEIPPGNPTDSPPSPESQVQLRTWQSSDYADTVISAFGFYVSLLGIKATTENTLQLATRYFACLVVVGIASNCYYYYLNLQDEERRDQERNIPLDDATKYSDAFVGIILPLIVWTLCILRAYQFQSLIREAETEAEERTRGLVGDRRGSDEEEGGDSTSLPYGSGASSSPSYNDLELQVERGVSA